MKKVRGKVSAVGPVTSTHAAFNLKRQAAALAVSAAFAIPAFAQNVLPTGGTVVGGSGTIRTPSASTMTINQSTNSANINWTSFSIGANNSVLISQPGASSVLYNKVTGNSPSEIFGHLSANGQVWLVNSNGILFGQGATIDVGGLIASTLPVVSPDPATGRYVFANSGSSGTVVNQGTITALNGYVGLFAPQVINQGVISARLGSVTRAAGDKITLDMVGDGLIKVSVDQAALNAAVLNKGSIDADGGTVLLTARSANALLDTVINTDGVIRANTISNHNGTITLDGGDKGTTSASGLLEAKGNDAGTTGGTIKVLGQTVSVLGGTTISAGGDAGGGTVLIGGDYQGKNAEVRNAQYTTVAD